MEEELKKQVLATLQEGKPPAEVTYKALIEWKDGVPYLSQTPVRLSEGTPEALRALLHKCLDLPYDGSDPALAGLSLGEATIINTLRAAADGDASARTAVIDRILGRPKQNIESVSLTGNLTDFLDKVAEDMETHTVDVTPEPAYNPHTDVEDL